MGKPIPKQKRWKSKRYIDWIKTQRCIVCFKEAEPHHIIGVGNMSGMGMKAPDWAVMPLCHEHHMLMHEGSVMQETQWQMIALTLGMAIDEGILK